MGRRKSSSGKRKNRKGPDRKGPDRKSEYDPLKEDHRKTPPLPRDDAQLWAKVTQSLQPLKSRGERHHFGPLAQDKPTPGSASASSDGLWPPPPEKTACSALPSNAPKSPTPRHGKASHDTLPVQRRVPDLTEFTRRDMRRIDKGRQSIEARLDLHGLRQGEAHMALKGFLRQSQDQGLRDVLVITGKGRTVARDEMLFGEHEPGILRRKVPQWLSEPDLRHIVSGYTEAPARHGGEGALYVRLRRAR